MVSNSNCVDDSDSRCSFLAPPSWDVNHTICGPHKSLQNSGVKREEIKRSCYAQGDHVGDYQMLFDHDMDELSRHDIDPTCRYNAIESVKK